MLHIMYLQILTLNTFISLSQEKKERKNGIICCYRISSFYFKCIDEVS